MSLLNILSKILVIFVFISTNFDFIQTRRVKHSGLNLDKKNFQCFSTAVDDFRENLLRPLLIERVSGTIGNTQARQHILSKLHSTNLWDVELDTFDSMTPDGQVEFTNIVATLDPTATRRLVLACHYDSKKLPNFVGATDSAVPCAMLLDIAINLQEKLRELKLRKGNPTLQLIFFDGEEAVRDWTATDSIYGSRHLATKMRHRNVPGQANLNEIDAMDIFVLLDLIGHRDIKFSNFFDRTTGRTYNRLRDIETELVRSYKLNSNQDTFKQTTFTSSLPYGHIEDDHIPFLNYDVPILHLISVPFPSTWHTINDNEANLDFPTINHIRNVMKIFVIEYLHLKQQVC